MTIDNHFQTETGWPYDADQHDPLTALRIPVVGSAWPRWSYIVAFDSGRLDQEQNRPTDAEAAMLVSFLQEYIEHFYNEAWKAKLKERPFDIDGGANGLVFRKWGPDDWGYRKHTWQYGPTFVPDHPRLREENNFLPGPLSLLQVMDRIHCHGRGDDPSPRWKQWKAARPEIFAPEHLRTAKETCSMTTPAVHLGFSDASATLCGVAKSTLGPGEVRTELDGITCRACIHEHNEVIKAELDGQPPRECVCGYPASDEEDLDEHIVAARGGDEPHAAR